MINSFTCVNLHISIMKQNHTIVSMKLMCKKSDCERFCTILVLLRDVFKYLFSNYLLWGTLFAITPLSL